MGGLVTNEEGLDLVLVIPDPGRALVLLGLDVGNAGIVVDGGVVIAWGILWGSNSSTRMFFLVGKYIIRVFLMVGKLLW